MFAMLKRTAVIVTLIGPAVVFAGASQIAEIHLLAANDVVVKEGSNHQTNKKAIVMEAKEKKIDAQVRNWAEIDVNKDHSISPEEMETYLNNVRSAKQNS